MSNNHLKPNISKIKHLIISQPALPTPPPWPKLLVQTKSSLSLSHPTSDLLANFIFITFKIHPELLHPITSLLPPCPKPPSLFSRLLQSSSNRSPCFLFTTPTVYCKHSLSQIISFLSSETFHVVPFHLKAKPAQWTIRPHMIWPQFTSLILSLPQLLTLLQPKRLLCCSQTCFVHSYFSAFELILTA